MTRNSKRSGKGSTSKYRVPASVKTIPDLLVRDDIEKVLREFEAVRGEYTSLIIIGGRADGQLHWDGANISTVELLGSLDVVKDDIRYGEGGMSGFT